MKGQGYYDRNSDSQRADIDRASELLRTMTSAIPSDSKNILLADFGCGCGAATFQLSDPIVDQLIGSDGAVSITIVRNDICKNDFNALADQIAVSKRARVTEFFAPGSFYERVLPDNSLHLGVCFSALQWMPSLPSLRVAEHVTHEVNSKKYADAYELQWQRGWQTFLRGRAAELVRNGQLLVSVVGQSGDGRVHAPFELLNLSLRTMVEDGLLNAERVDCFQMPIHRPRRDEVVAPFSIKSLEKLPLDLQFIEAKSVECPLFVRWTRDRDSQQYARSYTSFIRAFSEPTVRTILLRSRHLPDDQMHSLSDRLADEIYSRIEALILESPSKFVMKRTQILIALKKC